MQDRSFGVIPLVEDQGEYKLIILQHSNGGFWGFPKGHAENGEEPYEAAKRELFEETGLEVVKLLDQHPLVERYSFTKQETKVYKEILFFICLVEGDIEIDGKEILDHRLCTLLEAENLLTYKEAKLLLHQVQKILHL